MLKSLSILHNWPIHCKADPWQQQDPQTLGLSYRLRSQLTGCERFCL